MKYPALSVVRPLELCGWQEITLDETIPCEHLDECPCCAGTLETIAALVGNRGAQCIRVGVCPLCGWAGYRDRPTRAWIDDFYLSAWDAKNKTSEVRAEKVKRMAESAAVHQHPQNTQTLLALIEDLPLSRESARILDIGCGYGGALRALKQRGFRNLFGVENSTHRARIASDSTTANIFDGDFIALAQSGVFERAQPFDLIFSSHVLEHVPDPLAFLHTARSLEKNRGYLILSMPNQTREPTAAIIFFLPHLHSLTPRSLAVLLARAGYELVNTSATTDGELYVLARATDDAAPLSPGEEKTPDTLQKFARELALAHDVPPATRRLWWDRKDNTKSGQSPFYRPPLFDKLRHALKKLRGPSLDKARSVLITDAAERLTDAPIEFQFDGPIRMYYK